MSFALIWFNEKRAAIDYVRLQMINEILNENQTLMNDKDLDEKLLNKGNK